MRAPRVIESNGHHYLVQKTKENEGMDVTLRSGEAIHEPDYSKALGNNHWDQTLPATNTAKSSSQNRPRQELTQP